MKKVIWSTAALLSSFFILYFILMGSIFYFYINTLAQYHQNVMTTKNKIEGVKFLQLLHNISGTALNLQDETNKYTTLQEDIIKIEGFTIKHPIFFDIHFKRHLLFLKKFHTNYNNADFYNFLDFVNNQNYRIGNIAEILFSTHKEQYFLGTLMTHYLPEFFISIGIAHNLLEEFQESGHLSDAKKDIFMKQNKLIYLSAQEVGNIIELLPQGDQDIDRLTKSFKSLESILKLHTLNLYSDSQVFHKLIEVSDKLYSLNSQLLQKLLYIDKKLYTTMIQKYNFLLAFLVLLISAIFFYTFRIFDERLKYEQHLLQQSRLAQMGEMISMIAHQWRQPLGAISTTAVNMKFAIELEEFDLDLREEQEKQNLYFLQKLSEIESFVQNLTTTIDDFRNFYRPNKKITKTTFEEICVTSLNIIQTSLEATGVEVIHNYNSHQEIKMYSSEIMQVLLNIFKNAQDNFNEKRTKNPKITIITQNSTISICDNGGGIPKDILENIFDPYFSTKEAKNGTGLGLYMSKTIVEGHHHGKLSVKNSENGACFTISL